MIKNLRQRYKDEIIQDLMKKLGYSNPLQVPKLEKIIVNMGMGEAANDAKYLDAGLFEITTVTGQKPVITRAKKAISTFKIRKASPVGCMVTLRGQRMYDFFSKLVNFILPRLRDFKGVSPKSFDGRGNYNLGLKEQIVFPEIVYDKVAEIRGMDIAIVTTSKSNEEAQILLESLGMPFRKFDIKGLDFEQKKIKKADDSKIKKQTETKKVKEGEIKK